MTSAAAPAKVARPRILVVDDDYLVAAATSGSLQDGGFEVLETAASAEEAIALARSEHPLLILMDIRLAGGRDGIDAALESFRSLGIRCIFATAHADPVTRARRAGGTLGVAAQALCHGGGGGGGQGGRRPADGIRLVSRFRNSPDEILGGCGTQVIDSSGLPAPEIRKRISAAGH